MIWREADGRRWLEASLPGATAAFTTRSFGSAKESLAPLAALGIDPARIVSSRQVHGTDLAFHGRGEVPLEADGHVIAGPGTVGLVFGADCLPVALVGPGGAAILHCGRRGLEAGMATVGAGAVRATAAAVGPGIGPCCYEVDLWREARRQLREAGVGEIESADACTCCEPELFFSHRRDGDPRRQAGLVWLDSEEDRCRG
jgi:purine-nucleoside/S-methyl-5'-thioadenosine phosphorylase / adenosine deaminase